MNTSEAKRQSATEGGNSDGVAPVKPHSDTPRVDEWLRDNPTWDSEYFAKLDQAVEMARTFERERQAIFEALVHQTRCAGGQIAHAATPFLRCFHPEGCINRYDCAKKCEPAPHPPQMVALDAAIDYVRGQEIRWPMNEREELYNAGVAAAAKILEDMQR